MDKAAAAAEMAKVDWAAVDAITDAEIAAGIEADPDAAPDLTLRALQARFRDKHWALPAGRRVRLVRMALGLSQSEFSAAYRIPLRTLQGWERGARAMGETAAAYIRAIAFEPDRVRRALRNAA
ncbi:MAG: helix-turn-helix domain-containing protein [Dongiaceae bacterium]